MEIIPANISVDSESVYRTSSDIEEAKDDIVVAYTDLDTANETFIEGLEGDVKTNFDRIITVTDNAITTMNQTLTNLINEMDSYSAMMNGVDTLASVQIGGSTDE
ncbi:MAG: hypothetical protein E7284_02580 [Lachnospiraceae bacterium]|nr:hypothetical protein [Lachnospiraceae bacterium]